MAGSPAINIRSSHIDEQNSTRYLMEAMIGERMLRQSFLVSDEARYQPGLTQHIMDYHERAFQTEVDMVTWTSNTGTSKASSTASYHQAYYYANSTSATTNATTVCEYDRWYTSATTATATPIMVGYSSNEYVCLNGIHIKQVHLTHAQKMQLKINSEWEQYCREERLAEQRRKYRIEVVERETAENKAITLLESFIGKKEIEVYKKTGKLYVKGKNGLYIAKRGGGVQKIEGNKVIDFCVHIERKWKCPPTDEAIAMKFLLEDDDKNIIKIANRMSIHEYGDKLPIAACM